MSEEKNSISKLNKQEDCKTSLLHLPDVVLDCILEQLSPVDLCRLGGVCSHLRNRSRSDYLWEKHVEQKWSSLFGEVGHHQWESQRISITKPRYIFVQPSVRGCCGTIHGACPFGTIHSYLDDYGPLSNLIKNSSKMALYICLQTGRFWFPAQVFENVSIMYQCYDIIASYDSRTHTFQARFGYGHFQVIKTGIQWDRLRMSPPETYLKGYYNANCLIDLKPGDSIEIQTRTRNDFPYGWRFGEVIHLESCEDKETNDCSCQKSETLVVEFKKFVRGSLFKRLILKRNMSKEIWDGSSFYGGIRKLNNEEIQKWNNVFNS